MDFTVFIYFLVTTLTPSCNTQTHSEVRYECGPHGTFQYCVEDDPGCVIGCHCHPGYYFDTETKICEPNAKLTHHSRRYLADDRGYDLPAPPTPTTPFPTPTATSYSNNVEVQKDTDELGDWLYNQFFKTIENQVINNSNIVKSNSNAKPLTRRSASGGPGIKNKKKKGRKSLRGRRKRKHKKRKSLKHKLLRITEDDSLFDSDSGSDYSDSDDDYSDESYSDSEDESETDASDEKDTEGSSDKDHGHKKVIVFNRRPKPPLPSFIFVPNMDTPYYPPIGLPPPPLLPMYPMPVVPPPPPPMMPIPPPPLIIPLPPMEPPRTTPPAPPQNNSTTQTNSDTTTTATTTAATSTNAVPITEDAEIPKTRSGRRDRLEKLGKKSDPEQYLGGDNESGKQKNLKLGQKIRLMQKLMEKMKIRRRNNSLVPVESLDDFQDQDYQNDDVLSSLELPHKTSPKKNNNDPQPEDVDFKYLTELIHKVSKSTATRRPPSPFDLNHDLPQQSRRNFRYGRPYPQALRQSSDDIYYSNLGRQMASMIRNTDSDGYPQFSKNIEIRNRQIPFHSVLKENNPRSFWERSVRSLQPQRGHLFEYLDETRTLRHSNEKGLINLENEVEMVASTTPPLSLQELENILSTMKKAHALIKSHPRTSEKQSNVSLNINLLPKHVKLTSLHETLYFAPEKVKYRTQLPRIHLETTPAVVANKTNNFHEPKEKYDVPFMDYWMHNVKKEPHQPKSRPKPVLVETRKLMIPDNQTYNTKPVSEKLIAVQPTSTEPTISRQHYLQFLNNVPFTKETIPKSHETKVVKYKSFNNFLGNKPSQHESIAYPLLLPFKAQLSNRANKPSYFHRHSHHFEFFD